MGIPVRPLNANCRDANFVGFHSHIVAPLPPEFVSGQTRNLAEASTDYIGHYLNNPGFIHDHGEIEPSFVHKRNRPTKRESLQPAASQYNQAIRILLRESPVLRRRKGEIHYTATIDLQSYEGKTRCPALFRYVAGEKETGPR